MFVIPKEDLLRLTLQANSIRQDIVTMVYKAQSGHPGGALGMADVFTVLYHYHCHIRPHDPLWTDRDYVLLSNGHICPVWYASLASVGYFPKHELNSFRKINSLLQGHPHMPATPGVENSGGPLAQGTSQAVGIAIGLRMQGKDRQVYCLTSDGEHEEGQTWEAIMLAEKYKLGNLIFIVDRNHIQIDGPTDVVSSIDVTFEDKYRSFGWQVYSINGHDMQEIKSTLDAARNYRKGPVVVIANTIPGKGVSFMERNYQWHGKAPNDAQYKQAMDELQRERTMIEQQFGG